MNILNIHTLLAAALMGSLLMLFPQLGQAQLVVEPGANIVVTGAPKVVLKDIRLQTAGTITPGQSDVIVRGNGTPAASALAGTVTINLYDLDVDHSTNGIQLETNVQLSNRFRFVQGMVELNNQNIELGTTGFLMGEAEAKRITGTSGGQVRTSRILNGPAGANPGNIGFAMTSTAAYGNVTLKRGHVGPLNVIGTQPGIDRYFEITPSASGPATVRFYYFDAENAPAYPEGDLVLFRSTDGGTTWAPIAKSGQDQAADWVEATAVDPGGLWTLSDCGYITPSFDCPLATTVDCQEDAPLDLAGFVAAGGDTTDNCVSLNRASFRHVGDQILNMTCANRYEVERTYEIANERGVKATCKRTITVQDIDIPVISLNGPGRDYVCLGDVYTDPGATASDNCSGNITGSISVSGTVNTAVAGTYRLRYNVRDACGNPAARVTRRVIVRASPNVQVLPADVCPGTWLDIASLPIDYAIISDAFYFYSQDPALGASPPIGNVPVYQGRAFGNNRQVMARIMSDTCFWVIGVHTGQGFPCPDTAKIIVTVRNCGLPLAAAVMLEGAFDSNSGQMRDNLRSQNLVPTTEPYTALGYSYVGGGNETTQTSVLAISDGDAIVDWIVLELRDAVDPRIIRHSRSALLQKDGDIVDTDGTSTVSFTSMPAGNYYFAVLHRNHLGVMTAQPIQLDSLGTSIDFTDPSQAVYGNLSSRTIVNGNALLFSGDADGNGQVQNTDNVLYWIPQVGTAGYKTSDYNLDGQVQNTDMIYLWIPNAGKGTSVPR